MVAGPDEEGGLLGGVVDGTGGDDPALDGTGGDDVVLDGAGGDGPALDGAGEECVSFEVLVVDAGRGGDPVA